MNILPLPGGHGFLGLSACPGWHADLVPSASSRTLLHGDLAAIAATGSRMLVTLLAAEELERIGAETMRRSCAVLGLTWEHCPIRDMQVPGELFERTWSSASPQVHRRLEAGETVTLHCRAGLGRTGTIAARVLIERGAQADVAIALVRQYRPGAIETAEQEAWVRALPVGSRKAGLPRRST